MNNGKSNGKNTSVTESLTSLRISKSKDARDDYGFNKVWASDGRIMVMEEGSAKREVICGKLLNNNSFAYWVMEKTFLFYLFWIITLEHIRVFKGKNFTILFVYFLRSFSKWRCAFKKSRRFIFLIFLITENVILMSLLCFSTIKFLIEPYFKSHIKLKINYQRSLKLLKQNKSYLFQFFIQ